MTSSWNRKTFASDWCGELQLKSHRNRYHTSCQHKALPPSCRTAVPVVADSRFTVINVGQSQRPLILEAEAFAEKIFDLTVIQLVRVLNYAEIRVLLCCVAAVG